jgi:hypothetical protein
MAPQPLSSEQGRLTLIFHGAIIAVVGLLSGFGFVFEILNSLSVWPLSIEINGQFPGSERGWRVAHVAGVMNGLMLMIAGLVLVPIGASLLAKKWIVWGLVYTGWGNTLFFHLANFSNNRGLSAGTTHFGEADWAGILGYLFGASTIPFTLCAFILMARAAHSTLNKK